MEITTRTLFQLVASEGKVIARKSDGELLGPVFHPGINDSPDNYIEVDIPEEEESVDKVIME